MISVCYGIYLRETNEVVYIYISMPDMSNLYTVIECRQNIYKLRDAVEIFRRNTKFLER